MSSIRILNDVSPADAVQHHYENFVEAKRVSRREQAAKTRTMGLRFHLLCLLANAGMDANDDMYWHYKYSVYSDLDIETGAGSRSEWAVMLRKIRTALGCRLIENGKDAMRWEDLPEVIKAEHKQKRLKKQRVAWVRVKWTPTGTLKRSKVNFITYQPFKADGNCRIETQVLNEAYTLPATKVPKKSVPRLVCDI